MDNYLIDRETLGKFVDELIKNKTLPVATAEGLNDLREQAIKDLDDRIADAVFGKFTKEQNAEFNKLLDDDNTSEEDYENFFNSIGFNLDEIISDTMKQFAAEFLKGEENA